MPPARSQFPLVPAAWYYACPTRRLPDHPRKIVLAGNEFVAFETRTGTHAVLSNRCVHLGADLSHGTVVGEHLRCPFHEWEFGADGKCVRIPASEQIPRVACQAAYPTASVGGHLFFFNRATPAFEMPFFDGVSPDDLLPARPFDLRVRMPWYMIAANGFDLQHFRAAHDRELIDEPIVSQPSPDSMRVSARFRVSGENWRDRLTRRFSGPEVTMTVTSYRGTLVLVSAQFRRTTSYGMVCITPIDAATTHLRTIVWVRRSASAFGRRVFDPVDAEVRRSFIRAFVRSDQVRSAGTRYTPGTLIDADAVLKSYFDWLASTTA